MLNILVIDTYSDVYKKQLEAGFPGQVSVIAAPTADDVGDEIEQVEVIAGFKMPDDVIRRAVNLKWIQAMTTGTDYVLNLPSLKPDTIVTSTRGIHGPQMSEMAILLMMALGRGIEQVILNQKQAVWERWPGTLLWNKKVGLLGTGISAEAIALKCKAFDMETHVIGTVKREIPGVDVFHTRDELHQVMAMVDFFILVAPAIEQNLNIIDAEALDQMKPEAFLINIGRGELVDEPALLKALQEKRIAGAACDTFRQEPLPSDSPFWKLDNMIITPHISGMIDIYPQQVLSIFEKNVRLYLQGEKKGMINYIRP